MSPRKLISVVTPCFNEQDNVPDCYEAVRRVFERDLPGYDYEHVFCDNASTDDTPAVLRRLAAADPRVKVILNARNVGPFRSAFNGILGTTGDAVLLMLAADLQDPPELLPEFVRRWEAGHEVVYGVREVREEGRLMRAARRVYYRTVSRLADIQIPVNTGEFQLVDRKVVDALRACDDYYPYIRGLVANCGFRRASVGYTWRARKRGFSKNRLYHLVDQGLNGLISFSNVPMRLCMLAGVLVSVASVGYAAFTAAYHLVWAGTAPPGVPTLITALFLFSGLQLFFFGVLGEYVSAIHSQVRRRPLVVERERLNFDAPPARRAA
ncbi:glycosyltransferase family 2 protein [bacterium]|nr:glycosyltransferase family 2 protein [bacterium]